MSRSWSPRPPRRYYPPPPRSLWRKLLDYALTVILLGLLILLAARLDRFETRKAEGVAIVNDGDSLTLGTERIRMRGIDAPEYQQICRRDGADYACGRLARQALVRLISGNPVTCSGWQRERYGRLLGDCKAGGKDLNRAQVEAGWAIAYGDFDTEQAIARAGKVGIWAAPSMRRKTGAKATTAARSKESTARWLRSVTPCERCFASGDEHYS